MEGDSQEFEREPKRLLGTDGDKIDAGHVEESDEITPSPESRAQAVWAYLQEHNTFSTWDLICFCAEFLGLMSAEYEWLKDIAVRQTVLVYKYHYLHREEIAKWDEAQLSARAQSETKVEK